MGKSTSPSERSSRVVRVVPVAYSTYAPQGHSCADCKSLIGSGTRGCASRRRPHRERADESRLPAPHLLLPEGTAPQGTRQGDPVKWPNSRVSAFRQITVAVSVGAWITTIAILISRGASGR